MGLEKLVFIDTETTGMSDEDRVCQVAYKVWGENTVVQNFKPPCPIGLRAMAINHITEKIVADCEPFEGSQMWKDLADLIADGYILVAHNAAFDLKMLAREGIVFDHHIDTMKLSRALGDSNIESHQLQYLRYYYELEVEATAHSAAGDVDVLVAVFTKLHELYGNVPVHQLIETGV